MDRAGEYSSDDDDDVPTYSQSFGSSNGYFVLVAGNVLPSIGNFRVAVYSYGYEKKKDEIEIVIKSTEEDFEMKERVTLSGTKVQNVDFKINNPPEGEYNLKVSSLSGEYFDQTRCLHMNLKKYAVFVQTDKSVYKPSDNIKFRVMVLDAETRPYNFDKIDIYVTDGGDNRIKQYEEVGKNFIKGVYQNELQLSDLPVMGVWKIHVKINNDQDIEKTFDVEEYVLPKFEVSIDTVPNVPFKDGVIKATVNAKYTFGKIAKGKATVTAEVESPYGNYRFRTVEPTKKVSKTVEVDRKKFVEFDLKSELNIRDSKNEHTVKLHASFKDELSSKVATANATVKIHSDAIKMVLKKSSEKFKPGLPFTVTAILSSHDKSTPVIDPKNPVKFTVTSYYDILRKIKSIHQENICGRRVNPGDEYECWEENSKTQEYKVPLENGIAKLDIDVPKETTSFSVEAKYLGIEQDTSRVQKVESMCRQYLQGKLLTERPNLLKPFNIKVQATNMIKELTYQVLAGGKILESNYEKFKESIDHIVNIKPTLFMLPKASVVIYYVAENGEIISDKIDVEFGNQLLNHINLNLSAEQVKPGEDLIINVKSQPNSYVGLLGVDQSVLLLKKGNDIEQETVFDELKKFGEAQKYNYSHYYSGHDIGDFREMIMITNTKVAQGKKKPRVRTYQCESRNSLAPRAMAFGVGEERVRFMAMSKRSAPKIMNDMMMDAAPMVGGGSIVERKPVEIRKKFPETWLFDSLEFDSGDTKSLTKKVPDTITSWIITGFSLDPIRGLGITDSASKLRVFQPFIVDTNLPYSIKRGEVVSVPIIIFNYLDSDQTTTVTMFNADAEFEFINPDEEENAVKKQKLTTETERKQEIVLKSDEGATVSFMIRPLKVGQITIKVVAESQMAGDGIEKKLKVEPEGVTQYMNEAVLIDLRSEKEFKRTIEILVPPEAVKDSTRVEVSAIGDILGPSIDNLDKLIKLPYGCGEQNMLNFVPNIVILEYLTNLNKLNPQIEEKAKKYMEVGYQKELTYKHDDGSYSAFGMHDKSGSTWLTAFVAKSFSQASKYIKIDQNKILEALNFLKSVQAKDGSFPEVGTICHRDMQGGASKGMGLTAYTLITFLENKPLAKKFEDVIKNAQNYIFDNLETLDDNYSLAIVNYALQLSGNDKKDVLLEKLNTKSVNKDGMKHWSKEIEKPKERDCWYHRPSSVNVEMSAYALQAFLEADKTNDAVLIMKWLVTQRNANGGFQSTQDTVVGLQALSKLAMKVHVADSDLQIVVKPKDSIPSTINVNSANSLVLQKHEISSEARHFEVSATGKGFSILQISYRYNLDISGQSPRFILNPVVMSTSNKGFLHISVGAKFVPDAQTATSNMAVMEVTLPSGFTFDNDHMSELLATTKVKKVETKDGDTIIMVYFDDIGADEIVPEFKAYRTHAVAKQKPAPIIIYDYYDNSRSARTFYNPPEILISDIAAA
ncbi:unnamed protein product [Chironomus riparius]|uniref:CD109 antigen n=1 Tax=Chironomus riparius TaxID=315576 RepID=A0A9P0J9Q4_9DIPT|nr:unnamed protein product [Chironomus riparius]